MLAIGANHDRGTRDHRRSCLGAPADANRAAILKQGLVYGAALPQLGASSYCCMCQDGVQYMSAWDILAGNASLGGRVTYQREIAKIAR
jgi:hypothetical protein